MWTTLGFVCFVYVAALFLLLRFFSFVRGADERMQDAFTQSKS